MITNDLIEYIKKQIAKNIPESLIISKLTQIGWRLEDVIEGLEKSKSVVIVPPVEIQKITETKSSIEV